MSWPHRQSLCRPRPSRLQRGPSRYSRKSHCPSRHSPKSHCPSRSDKGSGLSGRKKRSGPSPCDTKALLSGMLPRYRLQPGLPWLRLLFPHKAAPRIVSSGRRPGRARAGRQGLPSKEFPAGRQSKTSSRHSSCPLSFINGLPGAEPLAGVRGGAPGIRTSINDGAARRLPRTYPSSFVPLDYFFSLDSRRGVSYPTASFHHSGYGVTLTLVYPRAYLENSRSPRASHRWFQSTACA